MKPTSASPERKVDFPQYNDNAVRHKSPSAIVTGRTAHTLDFTSKRQNPGPGQYEPRYNKFRSTSFVFGNAPLAPNKNKLKLKNLPGPGSYQPKDDFGVGTKAFSILGRLNSHSKSQSKLKESPGPGTYGKFYIKCSLIMFCRNIKSNYWTIF